VALIRVTTPISKQIGDMSAALLHLGSPNSFLMGIPLTVIGWCIAKQITVLLSGNLVRKTNKCIIKSYSDCRNLHPRTADHENSADYRTIFLCGSQWKNK
jgi:hypothetical protein